MAKKKAAPKKSNPKSKKSCSKKCSKKNCELKKECSLPVEEIKTTKSNYLLGLMKKAFGYE